MQLVNWPGIRDDLAAVGAVHRVAVTAGDVQSLSSPAMVRARHGDTRGSGLYQQAIEGGSVDALTSYAAFLPNFGAPGEPGEEILRCRERVAAGETGPLALLGALLLRNPALDVVTHGRAARRHPDRWIGQDACIDPLLAAPSRRIGAKMVEYTEV